MKKIIALFVLLTCLQQSSASDDYQHGLYAVLAIGRGYNNFSANNFSSNPTYNDNAWTLAGRAALGFNIDQYIGVEVGGHYFRERKFSNVASSGYDGFINEHAYTAQTVIRWPFASGFNLLAKFGPAYVIANRQLKATSAPVSQQGLVAGMIKTWEPMYSLGLSMVLKNYPGLSLLAEYSAIAKDSDKQLPSSELYSLGIIFHF